MELVVLSELSLCCVEKYLEGCVVDGRKFHLGKMGNLGKNEGILGKTRKSRQNEEIG